MTHLDFDFDDEMGVVDGRPIERTTTELMMSQVNSVKMNHFDFHNVAYASEENLLMGHLD